MLSRTDRLRLVNFPNHINEIISKFVADFGWSIQKVSPQKHHPRAYEIKLEGYPWWTSGSDAVRSKMLIMKMMVKLLEHGYMVRTALDVSSIVKKDS